jgi:predicted RNA-binding protein with PIN domain
MSEAAAADSDEGGALLLPDAVRQRVVALTLEALEGMGDERLPANVRPVMRFAPQRRARLAAGPVATALHDEDFRSRVAARVRPGRAELAAALERGEPVAADPIEVAAVAYLLRPDGWRQALTDAVARIDDETQAAAPREAELDRLRRQVEEARAELTDVRSRLREQVARLKADNADLRRKLGAERSKSKEAAEEAERLRAAHDDAERQGSAAQTELRRMRARIDELADEVLRARQSDRAERGGEALRARLLLDALLAAAQGLRRELALPPVETLPADTVGPSDERPVATAGGRALDPADPALLEQLLAVPRAHLVIDGYNVTKLEWGGSLEEQRTRLLRELAPVAARSGAEVTVVFDGADLRHRPTVAPPRGVRVRFSPAGVTADEVVRDLVRAEPEGRTVVVVSSDREVAGFAAKAGARPIPSVALLRLLDRG